MNNGSGLRFGVPVAHQIQERLMNARVGSQFGMEGRGHGASLPDYDWVFLFALGGQDFNTGAETGNFGSADENHFDGRSAELAFADGTVNLAAVGVAADADVDGAEAGLRRILNFLGQQDGSGAGAEAGLGADKVF